MADFLHLDNHGTLTAIHAKKANSIASVRGVAVTCFEELVSQVEKNAARLHRDVIESAVRVGRAGRPACWRDGERIESRSEFLFHLGGDGETIRRRFRPS